MDQSVWRIRDAVASNLDRVDGCGDTTNDADDSGEIDEDKKGDNSAVVSLSNVMEEWMPDDVDIANFRMLGDVAYYGSDENKSRGDKLNIHHVHKAFDAAAYCIVRAYVKTAGEVKNEVLVSNGDETPYVPPLIQVMQSIESSRLQSLDAAAGKSVPSFLKKNNTIPWFHVPIVEQMKLSDGISTNPKQPTKQVKSVKRPSMDKTIVEKTGDLDKMNVEDVVRRAEKKAKRELAEGQADTEPAPKKTKTSPKTSSPKPSPPKVKSETSKAKQSSSNNGKISNNTNGKTTQQANVTRAVLCAAAAIVFQKCTPDYSEDSSQNSTDSDGKINNDWIITPSYMPTQIIELEAAKRVASKKKRDLDVTLDSAMEYATSLGKKIIDKCLGVTRRNAERMAFRLDVAQSRWSSNMRTGGYRVKYAQSLPMVIPNPFMEIIDGTDCESMDTEEEIGFNKGPVTRGEDLEWSRGCLPRLLEVLGTGMGHAIVHDIQWEDRAFRIADLLERMSKKNAGSDQALSNYGPHLIVTTGQDIRSFAEVFGQIGYDLQVVQSDCDGNPTQQKTTLRALSYHGTRDKRRHLRKHLRSLSPSPDSPFCFLGGREDSPYHVVLTTYSEFAEDYSHFCQIPFQAVVVDDGMSWLGYAHADPNSKLGKVWDTALWSRSDQGAGMAGVSNGSASWDFSKDDGGVDKDRIPKGSKSTLIRRDSSSGGHVEKANRGKLLVGLTARYRILLASNMHTKCNGQLYKAPVISLMTFLAPHFIDAVRDEWDKSKMMQCDRSIKYLRKLIARSVIVYSGSSRVSSSQDLFRMSVKSLNGEFSSSLNTATLSSSPDAKKQTSLQRKDALTWFRVGSSILNELSDSALDSILATVKQYNSLGFICEELVPASTLTASGANGAVTGPAAYRTAVRCGRQFSNEQSLRQHITSFHAPAGTWLCKICGTDCVTSQAKSHHEKTCKNFLGVKFS